MTIRIYPSRLPGEPLEVHQHGATTLGSWLRSKVPDYSPDDRQPIAVEVDGAPVSPSQWATLAIAPHSDVRVYPVPYGSGLEIAAWAAVAVSVASATYSLVMMRRLDSPSLSSTGSEALGLETANANTAKLGSPIRDLFGKGRIYPDYVLQPVSRFVDKTRYVTTMLLSLGAGRFSFERGDIKVGGTPVTALGEDFSYTVYPPGADVSADLCSENWYQSGEVGNTRDGGAGLDMGNTSPEKQGVTADSVSLSGDSLTLNGVENLNGKKQTLPEAWRVGSVLTISAPDTMWVNTKEQYSSLVGLSLAELGAYVGMPVTLKYNGSTYDLFVASYTAEGPDQPTMTLAYGSATGAAFGGLPPGSIRLAISAVGSEYKITQIDGFNLRVTRLVGGTVDARWPGFYPRTVLDFDIAGINDDQKWLGPFLACPENEVTDVFEVDFSFPSGIVGFEGNGNKRIRHVEWEVQWRIFGSGSGWSRRYDVYAEKNPNGLGFTERFELETRGLVEVRCRRRNDQGSNNSRDTMYWKALRSRLSTRPMSYPDITTIAIRFVCGSKISAQSDRRINIVATRNYDFGTDRTISGAYYHLARSLGLGDAQIDRAAIDALEKNYWTPRGEYFDHAAAGENTSALDIFKLITQAGMSYFLLRDGRASVAREGIKPWVGIVTPQETTEPLQSAFKAPSEDDIDGVDVTYTSATSWAEETVQCRTADNPTPRKIESMKLDGVVDRDRAWRIGMRKLLGYRYQRLTHTTATEMDALCYEFGDRLVLADDIPGSQTQSLLVTGMAHDGTAITLTVSEPIDNTITNPKAILRFQDGKASGLLTATPTSDFTLTVPFDVALNPDDWQMNDAAIEPLRLLLCSAERVGYGAVVQEITPGNDGTCQLTAVQYDERQYQYDDASYPGNVQ